MSTENTNEEAMADAWAQVTGEIGVAMLTAGGLAPCLSSAVGGLIERYTDIAPDVELIAYKSGYRGLLMDYKIEITPDMREKAYVLHRYGGSPIGNTLGPHVRQRG